jgi:hypothetical protein
MRAVADQLGLPFYPGGDHLLPALAHFKLFSQGSARHIKNLLHGVTDDVEVGIFDYQYTTGGGQHSQTFFQSVVAFRSPRLNLPDFALRPENVFHRIGQVLGYQDIDFESRPDFSKAFLLRGSDEARIREVFDDEVLEFFEGTTGVCVEGGGDQLIYCRSSKKVEPANTRSFMDDGFKVYLLFRSSAGGEPA